jgi:hypothetical protein
MPSDFTCPICGGRTVGLSPVARIRRSDSFGWENDSSMDLLGLQEVETQLRLCPACFHSVIYPLFDTGLLYSPRAGELRKQTLEAHCPGTVYGKRRDGLRLDRDFRAAARDFHRFAQGALFVAKLALDAIRVLDWGGGDGYVGTLYTRALRTVTGIPTRNLVYDYVEWPEPVGDKVSLADLRTLPPCQVLILSNILEHTHDPVGTLRAAAEFLDDRGILICEVPDENYTIAMALVLRRRFGLHYHVGHFSRRSLHRTLEQAGLRNIHTTHQRESSYRGTPYKAILAVAQKMPKADADGTVAPRSERLPSLLGEALATAALSARVRFESLGGKVPEP